MNELHKKLISDQKFVPKEGQRDFLCSNKESLRCPSLDYKYVESSKEIVDKAFDILFEEIFNITKNNYGQKQISSSVRASLDIESRRSEDY